MRNCGFFFLLSLVPSLLHHHAYGIDSYLRSIALSRFRALRCGLYLTKKYCSVAYTRAHGGLIRSRWVYVSICVLIDNISLVASFWPWISTKLDFHGQTPITNKTDRVILNLSRPKSFSPPRTVNEWIRLAIIFPTQFKNLLVFFCVLFFLSSRAWSVHGPGHDYVKYN